MSDLKKNIFFWLPRIFGILIALFLSLFALDVFGEGHGFWKTLAALAIHLVPVYIVVICLLIGWKWELAGSVLFFILGLVYIINSWGQFNIMAYFLIAGPLFIEGILFIVSYTKNKAELA